MAAIYFFLSHYWKTKKMTNESEKSNQNIEKIKPGQKKLNDLKLRSKFIIMVIKHLSFGKK